MKQTQTEIKAIAAQLEAIRAIRSQPDQTSSQQEITSAKENDLVQKTQIRKPPIADLSLPPLISESHVACLSPTSVDLPLGDLPSTVESLRQRSLAYLQQLQPEPSEPSPPSQPERSLPEKQRQIQRNLELQVQRVNQLAAQQEAAVLELKAMFEKVGQEQKSELPNSKPNPNLPLYNSVHSNSVLRSSEVVYDYQAVAVPYVEKTKQGSWIVRTRSVDLFKAEREAALVAEALRYRTHRHSASDKPHHQLQITQAFDHWGSSFLRFCLKTVRSFSHAKQTQKQSQRRKKTKTVRSSHPHAVPTAQESLMFIVGAILLRIVMEWVVQVYPMLWLPMVVAMVMPAIVAVYRSTITPQSGFLWGCRLTLLMLGLLVGGRL